MGSRLKDRDNAGFWIRLAAGALDFSLLAVIWYFSGRYFYRISNPGSDYGAFYYWLRYDVGSDVGLCFEDGLKAFDRVANHFLAENQSQLAVLGIVFLLAWVYSAWLEAGPWQATVGKRLLGLKVTDFKGNRISAFQAILRALCKPISVVPAGAGVFAIGLSNDKLGFHDRLLRTKVIKDKLRYVLHSHQQHVMSKPTTIHITNSQGVVLTVAEHMRNVSTQVRQHLKSSEQPEEIKSLVKLLSTHITEIAEKIPPEAVDKMTKNVTRLSEELTTKTPDKEWCKLSLSGIKDAALAVGEIAKPVLEIVTTLWPLLIA